MSLTKPFNSDITAHDQAIVKQLPAKALSYQEQIKPILSNRCVVCHACYDAPCQLKLSSSQGILRGASKERVYSSRRLFPMSPSRLGIDEQQTNDWRNRGFFNVLNETENNSPKANLSNSLLYQFIKQKELVPQPLGGRLDAKIKLALTSKWACSNEEEYRTFLSRNPHAGMPYALPNLDKQDYTQLVQWIAQGSLIDSPIAITNDTLDNLKSWEHFLNQDSLKQQLVSRYIYEHIALGHIYFENNEASKNTQFFRLIRSKTPLSDGSPRDVDEIATRRSYSDPGQSKFYYRFKAYDAEIVLKTHRPYRLSDQKMKRFKQLFISPNYQVDHLPSYKREVAANPFISFAQIPASQRYQFLLDDAYFFINGFIKGPVCRGQVALNVINDHFWMIFIDPKHADALVDDQFLQQQANYLHLPAKQGNTLKIHQILSQYWDNQKAFLNNKHEYKKIQAVDKLENSLTKIFKGNKDAALTIFRHTDSASLTRGLIGNDIEQDGKQGQSPKTTMLMDYPLLERVHYLLVAGFDVFGNIGHQVNTRLYMDFLRMEGEDNFLTFIPPSQRKAIQKDWNQGIRERAGKIFNSPKDWLNHLYVDGDFGEQPKEKLYQSLNHYFENLAKPNSLNNLALPASVRHFIQQVNQFRGEHLKYIPDISFLRIKTPQNENENDIALTLVHHKAYYHLSSLVQKDKENYHDYVQNDGDIEKSRNYQHDSLLLLPWLEGDYPDFFLEVELGELNQFKQQFTDIKDKLTYDKFIDKYGIRRTNPKFWESSDWFRAKRKEQDPLSAGVYDLNRYENR